MGPPALISRVAALRYDMGSSPYLGRVIAEMIRNGDLDQHIVNLRRTYLKKLERVEDALAKYSLSTPLHAPAGRFFLWLLLRPA